MKYAGIQVTRQDNLTFRGLVPPTAADGVRMAERAPLVPDIKASLSYDEGKTPEQDFIFDVKTTRRSASTDYNCRDAYDTPHGYHMGWWTGERRLCRRSMWSAEGKEGRPGVC